MAVFDNEHQDGYIREVDDEVYEEDCIQEEPKDRERLAALEAAMLELIKGGVSGG